MKNEYKSPPVIAALYIITGVVALAAAVLTVTSGMEGFALFGPAAGIFLLAYMLDLIARILHEVKALRAQGEPAAAATAKRENPDYFLMINQKPTGPYPLNVLLNRLRMGTLLGEAQVQRAGTKPWIALETLAT